LSGDKKADLGGKLTKRRGKKIVPENQREAPTDATNEGAFMPGAVEWNREAFIVKEGVCYGETAVPKKP